MLVPTDSKDVDVHADEARLGGVKLKRTMPQVGDLEPVIEVSECWSVKLE